MESLPDLALLEIFKYLNFRDLTAISSVCSRFKDVPSSEVLWKRFCKEIWILDEVKGYNSWKEAFISYYRKYGKYCGCYKSVKSSWKIIEEWLLKNCPDVYASLNPGVDHKFLTKFENEFNLMLPSDYKLSYMLHNGQKRWELGNLGLFGGILLPNESYLCASLSTFESAINNYSKVYPCALPVTCNPIPEYGYFQVVSETYNDEKELCKHDPEIVFFCQKHCFSLASSFSEWLSQYAEKLANDDFLVLGGRILAYDKATEVKALTNHITVSVRWSHDRIFNSLSVETNLYSYIITMAMSEDAPQSMSCKLVSRHWEIEDKCGTSDVVDGKGVVGRFPVMRPGIEFTWTSCTSFRSAQGGSMKGYFTMRNLANPDITFDVMCPEFVMKKV